MSRSESPAARHFHAPHARLEVSPVALMLADGRLPTGGHAHSSGLEAAVARGLVTGLADLEDWTRGCLATAWWTDAAAAAMAARWTAPDGPVPQWAALDAELTARSATTAARRVARALGRQLARTARTAWPHVDLAAVAAGHPDGPLAPSVLGALAGASGLGPAAAAGIALHNAVQAATGAAVRLLALDPFAVAALVVRLAPDLTDRASAAAARPDDPRDLPATGAPRLDLLFAAHEVATTRLFAS